MNYVTIIIEGYGAICTEEFGFNYYAYITMAKDHGLAYRVERG